MEREQTDNIEKDIKFILFLDYIENLEPSINYPLQFNVHAEFHDNQLNLGGAVVINVMDTAGKINLEIPLNFPLNDVLEYNNFATHPMLIYFQSLNKIEKTSEEPLNYNSGIQTWVSVVDLLPLVYDTTTASITTGHKVGGQYPLKAVGELNRNLLSDTVAQLNVTVSRPEIISSFRSSPSPPNNMLNVTMHGLYNPPLRDHQLQHAATTCTATFSYVPEAIDLDIHNTVFTHSTYTDVTRDVNDLRWHSLGNKPATVSATGQRFEDFNGVVLNSTKIFEPRDVLSKGPRFEWNQWKRFLINETSSQIFQDFIFKHTFLPVAFTITNNSTYSYSGNKIIMSHTDSSAMMNNKMVSVAFLDLSMLLLPNCTSVRCMANVHMIDEEIMKNNTQSLTNFDLSEISQSKLLEYGHLEESTTLSSPTTFNNGSVDWKLPFVVVDISVTTSFHEQNLKYITTRLFKFSIIPENLNAVKRTAESTLNTYQEILKNTIEILLKSSGKINCPSGIERYVNKLKISGAYDSMQSSLCGEIQLYIKNNYRGPSIGETVQSFVNRIFVDLVDEMKKTVESFEFPHSDHVENVKFRTVFYAREADELGHMERAKIYLDLNSTADARSNPNYWLLYASFCSRRLDFDTAVEYVKEVLLVDSGNRIGLFMYAAIQLTIHEDNNNIEIVLKLLVMIHRDFSEAYALLSVHYSILKMYKVSYTMLQRANHYIKEDGIEKNFIFSKNQIYWQPIGHNNDPLIKCAILLIELEFIKLASHCLNLVKNPCEQYDYYLAVCEYKMGNHLLSLEHLKGENIIGKHETVVNVLIFLNNIALYGVKDILKNDKFFHEVVYIKAPCEELYLVYFKIAMYYYKKGWYAKAAEICTITCTVLRTPIILILLTKCLIRISELESAESALNEANILDVKNEEVWAYLALTNVKLGNVNLAKVCYTRALEWGLKPETKKEIDTLLGKKIDTFI